jgi:tetrahydromethanopterin S-methyltransferase subunit G
VSSSPDEPADLRTRVSALERRIEEVAADASAARHLAAANDRDYADVAIKVDANRSAINALGVQTAARFDQLDRRFEQVDRRFEQLERKLDQGFAEVRSRLDQTAAGQHRIVELLTGLIEGGDDDR